MKKLTVFILAAVMAIGICGTAGAEDFSWPLSNASTLGMWASPVTDTGDTVYVLAGGPIDFPTTTSGATLIMINPTTGTSIFWGGDLPTGTSAYGTPVVISGETVFIQVYKYQFNSTTTTQSGTSLVAINGMTGATYYTTSLPYTGGGGPLTWPWNFASGASHWTTSLTLDTNGTTIYGTSGVSSATGVSIWAVSTGTGALNSNVYNGAGTDSGVSIVWAAPLISGNSLYVMGSTQRGGTGNSGVSLLAFDKNNLNNGPNAQQTVIFGDSSNTPFATPAISGDTIYVVDAEGGLTGYNTTTLLPVEFIQYATASGVTASPVTNGSFLVVTANYQATGGAGVTVFDLSDGLTSGNSWFFEWTGATITATPAISNGELYMAVNKTDEGGLIERFNLAGHSGKLASPDQPTISADNNGTRLGFFDFSSPIIKGTRLIIVTAGGTGVAGSAANLQPRLYNFDVGTRTADGVNHWRQFKFDAARTGHNTAPATAAAAVAGSSGGCFISTIK